MTTPKRHRPGWLTNVFCSTVAVIALSAGAGTAFAQDNTAADAVSDLDAAKITQMAESNARTTMPQMVTQACSGADIVLVGDTDHTSLPVNSAMFGDTTLDAMAECGVSTLFIEMSTAFQGELDKYAAGDMTLAELRGKYDTFSSNFHDMDPADYEAKKTAKMHMVEHARDLGMRLIAADPQNGAMEGFMVSMMNAGAFKIIRRELREEFKPYYDLFMDGRDGEIPAADKEQFEQEFLALYTGQEVQSILAKVDALNAEMMDRRTNDTDLAAVITGHVEPGEKAAVIYGYGHFFNDRDVGLDRLLQDKGYKISRIDVFDNEGEIGYKPGSDLPQHVFIADSQIGLTLKPQQQAVPAPQPARGIKAEM